jgi:hypothetical protein
VNKVQCNTINKDGNEEWKWKWWGSRMPCIQFGDYKFNELATSCNECTTKTTF